MCSLLRSFGACARVSGGFGKRVSKVKAFEAFEGKSGKVVK